MKQSSESDAHRELVKMAAKRVLDEYNVENLEMTFHEANAKQSSWMRRTSTLDMDIWAGLFMSKSRYRLNAQWKLIPDIIAYALVSQRKLIEVEARSSETVETLFGEKESITHETIEKEEEVTVEGCVIVEAEINPKKGILANKQRMLGYRMIRAKFEQEDAFGNEKHTDLDGIAKVVLAIYDDIKFPKGTEKDPLPTDADVFDEIWRFKRGEK